MGLFDNFSKVRAKEVTLTKDEAKLLAGFIIVLGDADLIDEDDINASISIREEELKRFIINQDEDFDIEDYSDDIQSYLIDKDIETLAQMVSEALDDNEKLTLITNMIDISFIDGEVDEDEEKIINTFAEVFAIDKDLLYQIINVLMIKNNIF